MRSSNSSSPGSNTDLQTSISATTPICPPRTSRQPRPPIIWFSFPGAQLTAAAPVASPAPPQVLLAHYLRQLKLPTFVREYEKVAAEAAREGLDHVRFLLRLAELELIDRERRMVERRIRAARFPAVKSFDTFDFTAIPSLNKPLTLETRALRISRRPRQCYCSG
jgi:hypothetical protein